MKSAKQPKLPKTTQEVTTAAPPRDEFGRLLDGWGVPVNGPCRVAALAALGMPDPLVDPDAWEDYLEAPEALPFAVAATLDVEGQEECDEPDEPDDPKTPVEIKTGKKPNNALQQALIVTEEDKANG
jgi:hypothetical protein